MPARKLTLCGWLVAAALLLFGTAASADETFTARTAVSLPGTQKVTLFDISFVDPVIGLYLLADRTNKTVDVVDTTTNSVLVQLTATPAFAGATPSNNNAGPDGVITVNHREVWAGDGPSQIKVIDLFSQKTTHVISTGGVNRADEHLLRPARSGGSHGQRRGIAVPVCFLCLDRELQRPEADHDGRQRDVPGGKIASPVATNGIEQCQWDRRTGKLYVNIPEVNGPGNDTQPGAVVVISPDTMQIDAVYSLPISQCAGPQGMAIGPDHQILLGCNDPNKTVQSTVVIDDRNGHVVASVAGEDGADEVWFNDGDGQYFLANWGAPIRKRSASSTRMVRKGSRPTKACRSACRTIRRRARTARPIRWRPIRSSIRSTSRYRAPRDLRSARRLEGLTLRDASRSSPPGTTTNGRSRWRQIPLTDNRERAHGLNPRARVFPR